jgi:hypothetical protein
MSKTLDEAIRRQFGAAVDMLEKGILECPDGLWSDRSQMPEYWYVAFHTLFWLDYYLYGREEGFAPPAPFGLEEMDPAGVLPPRVYTKDELRAYLEHCRRTLGAAMDLLERGAASGGYKFRWGEAGPEELMLYNMRHVQHHAAQLYLILRQKTDSAPRWVGAAGAGR